ncbi:bifunctional pyr operon transcriptional regulator/uracil phosphoribosyltransferase PyrR [Facklamia miroungae]|uniref:Bifunctional protein PyrR n=1 Tax=Facklamia miroungae TaxID=120956 RepID=A0A1G7V5B2_9LACT|nr:bifunctional pyr operon transcriptional regulator/uracil phosphoribosyltransferase PyrR [Facklamia miroungae]NKZ30248.1 bifunctional pyr operon transcriptional regulator/uracil phosphoribosyltransferase PyrR [Facklamia miroungae]SDG55075.1 pyrimidine operon attenuation protein / uracil phosphoribosyltransferase [Facklamia miroungae]
MTENIILDEKAIGRTLKRMAHEIVERNPDVKELILVGIKTRGIYLAKRLAAKIQQIEEINVCVEELDISLYRDDLSYKFESEAPVVQPPHFSQSMRDKVVIMVDDVLYTGRTIRAGLDAILSTDRPAKIQLAILVDRGHRELPIRADFVGKNIPTSSEEKVAVKLNEVDHAEEVVIVRT